MSLSDFPDPSSYFSFKWASGYDKVQFRAMQNRVKRDHLVRSDLAGGHRPRPPLSLTTPATAAPTAASLSYSALATGWTFDSNYSGPSETGYTYMLTKLATDGAHAMTIVGYDDTVEALPPKTPRITKEPSIVVNSYGTWWGRRRPLLPALLFLFAGPPSQTLSHDVTGMQLHGALPAGGIPC